MHMHRAAGLLAHRLGHERRVDIVAQCHFAHRALEQKYLIGAVQWIAVQKIDLDLCGTFLVDQRIEVEFLDLAEIIHLFEQRIEFIDGIDRIGLPAGFLAAGPPDWWY